MSKRKSSEAVSIAKRPHRDLDASAKDLRDPTIVSDVLYTQTECIRSCTGRAPTNSGADQERLLGLDWNGTFNRAPHLLKNQTVLRPSGSVVGPRSVSSVPLVRKRMVLLAYALPPSEAVGAKGAVHGH